MGSSQEANFVRRRKRPRENEPLPRSLIGIYKSSPLPRRSRSTSVGRGKSGHHRAMCLLKKGDAAF